MQDRPENAITWAVIGAAISVHRELGPGLLESAYEACLAHEFNILGLRYERQLPLPIEYKGLKLDCGYRMDFVVDDNVVIELKVADSISPVHEAQCLTYLRFSRKHICLLLNFNVLLMKDGIKRYVLD
ncbi:MAG: GxxExxY protein [bacterium]|nr:GxxExxY protein [Candidatus Sumerlaeota bacterium]